MSLGIEKIKELKKEIFELIADGKLIMEDGKFTVIGDLPASMAAAKDLYDIYCVAPAALEEAKDIDKDELMELGKMFVELINLAVDSLKQKSVA
jgi:hypothetical protein